MTLAEPIPVLSTRILQSPEDWLAIETDWNDLFDSSPYAAPVLRFSWLKNWWRTYGAIYSHHHGLTVITFWRGRRLVGGLPLYLNSINAPLPAVRRVSFLSTGEHESEETRPDYLNLLCRPGDETACLIALQAALAKLNFDVVDLFDVPQGSPLLEAAPTLSQQHEITPRGTCPIANLIGGFDAYLLKLNAKHRNNAKRCLREAAETNATLEIATPFNAELFFNELIDIHQQRWESLNKPGCFAAPRFEQFHRAMIRTMIPQNQALLARVRVENQTVAVIYALLTRDKCDIYQCGVRVQENRPLRSPGVSAHLMLMQTLAQQGITRYDFLRGESQYKNSLATESREVFSLRFWRSTFRGLAHRSWTQLNRAIRH